MPFADASTGLCRQRFRTQIQSGRSAGWRNHKINWLFCFRGCAAKCSGEVKHLQASSGSHPHTPPNIHMANFSRKCSIYPVIVVNIVCLYQVLTVSPIVKTSSVRKSDNILRTDAPWGYRNIFCWKDGGSEMWNVFCCYLGKSVWGYLAVWDSIKQLTDLCWLLNVLFFRGQRVRGGQGIDGKHPMDIIQHNEVFLLWDKSDTDH